MWSYGSEEPSYLANEGMTKPLRMCWPNGEDMISSSPRTAACVGIYGAGAAPKVGYPNGSDGAAPPCHAGSFSRVCFYYRLSLLNSLRTRQGMSLMDRLERCGGLFLYSASTWFFGGGRSGSGELPEDNLSSAAASLSSGQTGSLPLFCLTGGAGWFLPHAFSIRSPSRRAHGRSFSYCRWSAWLCNLAICLTCSSCFASIS